jgi:hypothetical protein
MEKWVAVHYYRFKIFYGSADTFVRRIQESEIKDALKRMKGGKAMSLDGIPIEVWRNLRDVAIV